MCAITVQRRLKTSNYTELFRYIGDLYSRKTASDASGVLDVPDGGMNISSQSHTSVHTKTRLSGGLTAANAAFMALADLSPCVGEGREVPEELTTGSWQRQSIL